MSLRGRRPWQSASPAVQSTARPQRGRKRTDCQKVNCPEGAREATLGCVGLCPPRNDAVTLGRSFFCRCGSGHPGRGVPTGFYFGSFAALGTSYSSHRRAVGLRPPHHSWWGLGRPQGSPLREESVRPGVPTNVLFNPSSPAPGTVLPRGSVSVRCDFHPALSSGWCGPGRRS